MHLKCYVDVLKTPQNPTIPKSCLIRRDSSAHKTLLAQVGRHVFTYGHVSLGKYKPSLQNIFNVDSLLGKTMIGITLTRLYLLQRPIISYIKI